MPADLLAEIEKATELIARIALTVAATMGLCWWSRLSGTLKYFLLLLVLSCLAEWMSHILDSFRQDPYKNALSHAFSVVELSFTWLFFCDVIWERPGRSTRAVGVIVSAAAGCANVTFLQRWSEYNTNMLKFECLSITIMALVVLGRFLRIERAENPLQNLTVLVWAVNLFWWSLSFVFWATVLYYKKQEPLTKDRTAKDIVWIFQGAAACSMYVIVGMLLQRAAAGKLSNKPLWTSTM